jgi:apolipoprotein D and lipocalin family protein
MKIFSSILCILMAGPAAFAGPKVGAAQTVDSVDLPRFMGDWYVQGHTPTLVDNNTMNQIESYKLEDDGTIATTYTFYRKYPGGFQYKFTPKGRVFNTTTNAHWKMQFVWPLKGNYLIVRLAPDYSYTVVSVPKKDLIWIMSRSSEMSEDQYNAIVKDLASDGYPVESIRRVPQNW